MKNKTFLISLNLYINQELIVHMHMGCRKIFHGKGYVIKLTIYSNVN